METDPLYQKTLPRSIGQTWTPIPGPVDRVSFFDEQRKRRRQTWRLSALSIFAVMLMGLPLAVVLTPLAYMIIAVFVKIMNLWIPVPDILIQNIKNSAYLVTTTIELLFDPAKHPLIPLASLIQFSTIMLLPGIIVMIFFWLGLRSLFAYAGVGGILLTLQARPPHPDDLEERQLVNIVGEMAIASGIPVPRVMIIDSDKPNAAAIGSSLEDATVIVSRRVLDEFNRDETQGIIAHLIGSIGNGDLKMALSIIVIFKAFGLVFTIFDAVLNFSPSAWADLKKMLKWIAAGRKDPGAADGIATVLTHNLGETREDGLLALLKDDQQSSSNWIKRALKRVPLLQVFLLPFMLFNVIASVLQLEILILRGFLVGPVVMFLWRSRRYLADAMAVQLTRNADGLARSLISLVEKGAVIPGGQWAEHLFIVGSEAEGARVDADRQTELANLRQTIKGDSWVKRITDIFTTIKKVREDSRNNLKASEEGTWTGEIGGIPSHPPLKKRLKCLHAMDAAMEGERPQQEAKHNLWNSLVILVLSPLILLIIWLSLGAMGLSFMLASGFSVFFAGLAMRLIYALFI